MRIAEMLSQSGILTLLGMVVVFSFILIMILCMNILHAFVHACGFDKENAKTAKKENKPVRTPAPVAAPAVDTGAIIAAIAAAIREKESV